VPEARLDDSGSGIGPAEDGWFVVNVRDANWWTSKAFGSACEFDEPLIAFPRLGFRLHVLEPGEPNGLYHSESDQEAFLVLMQAAR
jgi:hypothetical protein